MDLGRLDTCSFLRKISKKTESARIPIQISSLEVLLPTFKGGGGAEPFTLQHNEGLSVITRQSTVMKASQANFPGK